MRCPRNAQKKTTERVQINVEKLLIDPFGPRSAVLSDSHQTVKTALQVFRSLLSTASFSGFVLPRRTVAPPGASGQGNLHGNLMKCGKNAQPILGDLEIHAADRRKPQFLSKRELVLGNRTILRRRIGQQLRQVHDPPLPGRLVDRFDDGDGLTGFAAGDVGRGSGIDGVEIGFDVAGVG